MKIKMIYAKPFCCVETLVSEDIITKSQITTEERGEKGENIVSKKSKHKFWEYSKEINDYRFRSLEGKSCQIDRILIRENGIFVIETKNYSGMILGNDKQLEWTQILAKGKVKNRFYNPVKQNASHIYKLKEILGKDAPIFSMVVFASGNIENVTSDDVYTIEEMQDRIFKNKEFLMDMHEINNYYQMLIDNEEEIFDSQHIDEIEQLKENIENNICPRCGGNLIERSGKNGKFFGCENYPKCKFTKNS